MRSYLLRQIVLFVISGSFLIGGCGTMQNGRRWGEDAFSSTTLEKVGQSAYRALLDWQTLVPLAGALVFSIDDYDTKVSDWAARHHPLFGSESGAKTASDLLYGATYLEAVGTSLLTPSGEDARGWEKSKAKGIGVELLALGATGGTTLLLRETTHHSAPDGAKNQFPSGHASVGFGNMTLSNRNLEYIPMSQGTRTSVQAGNIAVATLMGWARVEARGHFPRDVLVGAALGHFLNAFIYDSLMGLPENRQFGISVTPKRGGAILQLSLSY